MVEEIYWGRVSKDGSMWTYTLYAVSEEKHPQVFNDLEFFFFFNLKLYVFPPLAANIHM